MNTFEYKRTNHSALIGRLYSAYSRADPLAANFFKFGIQRIATHPSSPAWKVRNLPAGGIEIVTPKINKKF